MAIQNRRGPYEKLDTTKLLPGEPAVVLQGDPLCEDGKSVYICFTAGDTKRMATYEDMVENIDDATEEVQLKFTEEVREATDNANTQAGYAKAQGSYAKNQGDYAKDRGKYAEQQAENAVNEINTNMTKIQSDFNNIKDIITSLDNGELLLRVEELLNDMYRLATEWDIDSIIAGTYADEDEQGSIFETGTTQDIDEIISGEYVDNPEEYGIDDKEIHALVDGLFK